MKRILLLLLMMILTVPLAIAETRWQDQALPPDHIKTADVLYKVIPGENNKIIVGKDIPAGLYGIAGIKFENSPVIDESYLFGIIRGVEKIYESDILNTEKNADLVIPLFAGDCFIIATGGVAVVYLYSMDYSTLKLY